MDGVLLFEGQWDSELENRCRFTFALVTLLGH